LSLKNFERLIASFCSALTADDSGQLKTQNFLGRKLRFPFHSKSSEDFFKFGYESESLKSSSTGRLRGVGNASPEFGLHAIALDDHIAGIDRIGSDLCAG